MSKGNDKKPKADKTKPKASVSPYKSAQSPSKPALSSVRQEARAVAGARARRNPRRYQARFLGRAY